MLSNLASADALAWIAAAADAPGVGDPVRWIALGL